jgi:hypothetical protein
MPAITTEDVAAAQAACDEIRASMRAMMSLRNPRGAQLKRQLREAERHLDSIQRRALPTPSQLRINELEELLAFAVPFVEASIASRLFDDSPQVDAARAKAARIRELLAD